MGHSIRIPEHIIQRCLMVVREKMALVPPNPAALRSILEEDRCDDLVKALVRNYKAKEPVDGLDTYERDWLIEIVSDHFVGREPPTNSHSEEYTKAFVGDLVDAAIKAGWAIDQHSG